MIARRQRRGGFTLVELVLSMVVMTILLAGMSSAMVLASRALPDQASAGAAFREGCQALEQMIDELQTAKSFVALTATTVNFTVADRNADSAAETIRYAWSGVPGAAVTRKYNSQTAVDFLNDVHLFEVQYSNEAVDGLLRTTEVRLVVQIGADAAGRVELATHILNQPLVN